MTAPSTHITEYIPPTTCHEKRWHHSRNADKYIQTTGQWARKPPQKLTLPWSKTPKTDTLQCWMLLLLLPLSIFLVKLLSFWGRLRIGWVPKKQKRKLWGTCGADFYRPCPLWCPNQQFITWTSLRWPSSHITGTIFYPWIGRAKITAWSCPLRASDLIDICSLHPNCSKPAARRCCCWSKGQTDSWTDTVPSHRPSMLEVGHCQQGIARGRRDDMPTADGSSTVAKIAADVRPSADGSAVLTSLVAGGV